MWKLPFVELRAVTSRLRTTQPLISEDARSSSRGVRPRLPRLPRRSFSTEILFPKFVHYPSEEVVRAARVKSMADYRKLYKASVSDPQAFWKKMAEGFHWQAPPSGPILSYNFDASKGPVFATWFGGALTNVCYNALDRHAQEHGSKVAYYWEGNDPSERRTLTYEELLRSVCRFANVLKAEGVRRGDCVAIYMPVVPETVVAMLACARIGAVHTCVFAGFSVDSLAERMLDSRCVLLLTSDVTNRGQKRIDLKSVAVQALEKCRSSGLDVGCILLDRTRERGAPSRGREAEVRRMGDWEELQAAASTDCDPEWVRAEDPLFLLYTSGSTGKPKGVIHATGGYMVYAGVTHEYVFDLHADDVFWSTADVGWITGHTSGVYGPLLNAATGVLFEGVPHHPHPGRWWEIIDRYQVTKFYTSPTVIRSMAKLGEEIVQRYSLKSLRVLGVVGEPIHPDSWHWLYRVVGRCRCPIVDTYWQTETGSHVISPLPGAVPMKPGSASVPFFGVQPAVLRDDGTEAPSGESGSLVFRAPWPGMLRTLHGDHERFQSTYFSRFPGSYFCGDGAYRDEDGYVWIMGRVDDTLNISGHLLSTAQVEAVLAEHPAVSEVVAVSRTHSVKGQCMYCFVVPLEGVTWSDEQTWELRQIVRNRIGALAMPDFIHVAAALPKTRSSKTMRRLLRRIANNDRDLGDLSTLDNPEVIEPLFRGVLQE